MLKLITKTTQGALVLSHGLDNPTQVVKVNSLYRFDKCEIPSTKFASQCLDEFDNFTVKQENFNAYDCTLE